MTSHLYHCNLMKRERSLYIFTNSHILTICPVCNSRREGESSSFSSFILRFNFFLTAKRFTLLDKLPTFNEFYLVSQILYSVLYLFVVVSLLFFNVLKYVVAFLSVTDLLNVIDVKTK